MRVEFFPYHLVLIFILFRLTDESSLGALDNPSEHVSGGDSRDFETRRSEICSHIYNQLLNLSNDESLATHKIPALQDIDIFSSYCTRAGLKVDSIGPCLFSLILGIQERDTGISSDTINFETVEIMNLPPLSTWDHLNWCFADYLAIIKNIPSIKFAFKTPSDPSQVSVCPQKRSCKKKEFEHDSSEPPRPQKFMKTSHQCSSNDDNYIQALRKKVTMQYFEKIENVLGLSSTIDDMKRLYAKKWPSSVKDKIPSMWTTSDVLVLDKIMNDITVEVIDEEDLNVMNEFLSVFPNHHHKDYPDLVFCVLVKLFKDQTGCRRSAALLGIDLSLVKNFPPSISLKYYEWTIKDCVAIIKNLGKIQFPLHQKRNVCASRKRNVCVSRKPAAKNEAMNSVADSSSVFCTSTRNETIMSCNLTTKHNVALQIASQSGSDTIGQFDYLKKLMESDELEFCNAIVDILVEDTSILKLVRYASRLMTHALLNYKLKAVEILLEFEDEIDTLSLRRLFSKKDCGVFVTSLLSARSALNEPLLTWNEHVSKLASPHLHLTGIVESQSVEQK